MESATVQYVFIPGNNSNSVKFWKISMIFALRIWANKMIICCYNYVLIIIMVFFSWIIMFSDFSNTPLYTSYQYIIFIFLISVWFEWETPWIRKKRLTGLKRTELIQEIIDWQSVCGMFWKQSVMIQGNDDGFYSDRKESRQISWSLNRRDDNILCYSFKACLWMI